MPGTQILEYIKYLKRKRRLEERKMTIVGFILALTKLVFLTINLQKKEKNL